jgi:hypothetical protein
MRHPRADFPCFYLIQSLLDGGTAIEGLRRYTQNVWEDVPAIWRVWVPAQLLNFGFSPMWLRIPVTASVSVGWTAYVSFSRGGELSSRQ